MSNARHLTWVRPTCGIRQRPQTEWTPRWPRSAKARMELEKQIRTQRNLLAKRAASVKWGGGTKPLDRHENGHALTPSVNQSDKEN